MATDWTQDAETIGAWKMDDTSSPLQDSSPNNNDLAETGNAGTHNVTGQYGGAHDFTQQNNTGFSNASITGRSTHSITAWIAPDDNGDTNDSILNAGCIASRNDGNGWAFGLAQSNDLRYAHSFDGSGFSRWSTTGDFVPYTGVFTHVAVTYNGSSISNDPIIYVDGVARAVTEVTAPFGTAENGGTFLVGIDNGNINEFDGEIDELLYSSQIFSSTEINEIMDSGIDGTQGATNVTVTPSALSITASVQSPTVVAVRNVTITPSALSVVASVQAPTMSLGTTISPSTLSPVVSVQAPTVSTTSNVTITPDTLSVVASVQAPTMSTGATISPSALSVVASVNEATVSTGGNITISAGVLSLTASVQDPTVTAVQNVTVSPGVLSITASVNAPTMSLSTTISPSTLTLTAKTMWNFIDDCVLWFKMNENAASTTVTDYSSIASDGTADQNTSLLTITGKVNEALTFNGSSDYISSPVRSRLALSPLILQATACAWIKTTATAPDDTLGLRVFTHPRNNQISTIFGIGMADNKAAAFWNNSSSTNARLKGTTAINDGEWHFIAATWDGPNTTMKIYVDGVLENSIVTSANSQNGSLRAERIGAGHTATPGDFWDGEIDNLMVFDHLFTLADIQTLYHYGLGIESLNSVDVSTSSTITPSVQDVTVSIPTPSVNTGGSVTIQPGVLGITASVQTPIVSGDAVISAGVQSVTASVQQPTVSLGSSVTVTPDVLSLTASVQNPSVSYGTTISPSVIGLIVSVLSPTVSSSGNITISPSSLSITASVNSPTMSLSSVIAAAVQTLVASVQNPALSTGCSISPSVLGLTVSIPTPGISINGSITISASLVTLTVNVNTPTVNVSRSVTVNPSAIDVAIALLTPLIRATRSDVIKITIRFDENTTYVINFNENINSRFRFDENISQNIEIRNG